MVISMPSCICVFPKKRKEKLEAGIVSERRADQEEKEWSDEIPDIEEEWPDDREETYRDGSAKNECWQDQDR